MASARADGFASQMKNRIHIAAAVFLLLLAAGCRPDPVREAIARQLELYPESRVQDVYKSFCQDQLGPGHLILHHSPAFSEAYHPHYRIVARDIFENELKPRLCFSSRFTIFARYFSHHARTLDGTAPDWLQHLHDAGLVRPSQAF